MHLDGDAVGAPNLHHRQFVTLSQPNPTLCHEFDPLWRVANRLEVTFRNRDFYCIRRTVLYNRCPLGIK